MDLFPIVLVVTNVLMVISYIIMFSAIIYGIIQCLCVEDLPEDGSIETITQSLDEKELDTYPETSYLAPAKARHEKAGEYPDLSKPPGNTTTLLRINETTKNLQPPGSGRDE